MDWINQHVLSILVFLPLLAAFLTAASPTLAVARWVSLAGSLVTFITVLHVWFHFQPETIELQFVEAYDWLPTFGVKYLMGVDGISLLLLVLTGFLIPLVLVSVWHHDNPRQKALLALILSLQCGMLGALVALDLVFFYVFWEVMLIPMYFIIGVWGGKNRIYATTKFVLYTVVGSLLMLVASIYLYILHQAEFGIYSTSLLDLYRLNSVDASIQHWLFAAFALAFAIKVPVFPFHTWLPHAHTEAPTVGSVILAGVLLKMGTYGLLRFAIPLFPLAVTSFAPFIIGLGLIGIIYGALTAWAQPDAKKMVAYSSVSHLGFVVVGSLALVGGQLSGEALTGAVYQMINHGISTGALFFLVGMIYERRHTRLLADYGGIAKVMPWFAVMLIVATLGSVGLPGTGGFVGEFLILLGAFQSNPLVGVIASLGVLLGAVYMLVLCKSILFGPIKHKENESLSDLNLREWLYICPLAVLVVVMGVFPEVFLGKIRPSINHLADNYLEYRLLMSEAQRDNRHQAAH